MGAAGSSNGATSTSMPFRERSRETFIYGTEESRCPEYANENIRQRTRTSTFDVGEEPRSQGPSPYSTLRGEEWWNQRPSAPSLSNLRPPGQETLLTYAAQMTGWQTAEGNSPSFSRQHQEAMELSKVISQLAMANQQLASAHSTTLAHLEALYVELKKEKESRRRTAPSNELDEALKRRFTMEEKRDDENEEEQKRTIETRIDRLERQLSDNWDGCHNRQRNVRQGDDRRLRSRIEGLETMMKVKDLDRETERSRLTSAHDGEENQTNNAECNDRLLNNSYILGDELTNRIFKPRSGTRFSKNVTCEDEPDDAATSHGEINSFVSNLHLEKSEREECDRTVIEQVQNVDRYEIIRLLDEIDRLRSEKSNYQCENERLTKELAEQKSMAMTLKKDYMESKTRHEQVECNLRERREEYEKLMAKFEDATKETERLLKEIDAVNLERESAESRISSLEKDLQKSRIEKEVIVTAESQKASKLKAQLSEEVSDKKKQIKALEDALDEIQRLKETMKTEKNEEVDDGSKENAVESRENSQENVSPEGTTNLEDFKKELFMKREARQRAIAAVSSEMERLRRELDAEKEAHSETSRVLDLLRSAQNEAQAREQTNSMNESWKASKTKEQKTDECDLDEQRTEARRLASILKVSDELKNDIRIQIDKLDDLRYQLETEPEQHRYRIRSLSELANRTREAVYTRERRSSDLKDHLAESLLRFGDRSYLEVKDDVGQECERQLENMNSLKSLYNERLKVLNELKETAVKELVDTKSRLDHAMKKCECLEEDLSKADEKIDVQDTQISNLESQLGLTKADCRDLQNQMSLINGLFTQMLLGATSADMDLDRLTQLLQENHDLICDMAREEGTEAAALPKLLLDLIEQVEGSKGPQKRIEGENPAESETEKKEDDLQQEDIAHNLPKVWRVLLELLSCHAEGTPSASAASSSSDPNICYKSVDTPAGPRLVISVSKTYIRLKELILEKKHLEKEMNRMKQLNTHLESKLGEQEKRLSAVSAELSKTWLIVDRMQAQHQQLHTHEKILRYELQQKRKMLQELKQELEYCREKWESARQKNTNTEIEWRSLRREFAARKAIAVHDSFSNSAESGFSDERGDDTDDEDNAVEDRIRLGPRRRSRKENPRAPTPDTESEQPTDTELSEPKIECLETSEERTPTPETEAELDEMEVTDGSLNSNFANDSEAPQLIPESPQESMNPLDQALTNVIQNLIGMDDNIRSTSESFLTLNDRKILGMLPNTDSVSEDPHTAQSLSENLNLSFVKDTQSSEIATHDHVKEVSVLSSVHENNRLSTITEDQENSTDSAGEKIKITNDESLRSSFVSPVPSDTSATVTQSVFSIGPFVTSNASSQPSIVKNVQFSEPLIVGPSNQFFAPVFGATLSNETFTPSFASSTDVETDLKEKSVSKMTETAMDSDDISVESSSSLDTVKDFSPANTPSTSSSDPLKSEEKKILAKNRTPEEALAAREDRLKRLEEQAKWLMNKMSATNRRGSALSTRLEELHEVYGEPPVPPPMPDVLPSRRLRTNLSDLPQQVPESSTTEDSKNTETKTNESPPSETP